MGGHSDVGFPFGEASLGISYAGFSKLKQELPPPLGPPSSASVAAAGMASSRPPWALPPMMGPGSSAATTEHHGLPLLGHGGRSFSELHSTPVASSSSSFGVPYDVGSSMYKASPLAAASSAYGSLKERGGGGGGARHQHYPLQYNGGSLVLDHHRGELINLSKMTQQEILDAKALAASKSHSEAERRRRERINNHLNTLRSLLPSTTKTDKASLLAEVIQHVKELKRQAAEIAEGGPVPSDVDEIKVDADSSSTDGNVVMKASLCCDDRPDLLSDLTKVLKTLKLKTLKAEIATLGGRVKNVLVIGKDAAAVGEGADEMAGTGSGSSSSSGQQDRPSVNCVQEALRAVIERSSNDASASGYSSGGKRQKMNNHHHESSSSGY